MTTLWPVAGLVDSHIHTTFSPDSRAPMAAMVERGIALGLRELTFTEHLDLDPAGMGNFLRPAAYIEEIERCRRVYGDRIVIRAGLEVGDVHRYGAAIAARLAGLPLDFLIGSVHFIDGEFVGGPGYIDGHTPAAAIGAYFEQVLLASTAGGFDVHGHFDVFKRASTPAWGCFAPEPWAEPIREALRHLIAGGRGLEINTSGLRTPAAEPCPGLTILRWYRELGGEILTLGSDSHRVEHLGYGLDAGAELARAAGFAYVCAFAARRPVWHAL